MGIALVIMAAGIGSRFGGGIKQLEKVGPDGEIIMDYSIHDAIQASFDQIVFVIRRDIEKEFREIIGDRIEKLCAKRNVRCDYVFQDLTALPEGFTVPEGRAKPWGTCHAVLAAKEKITGPFAVINADDYYGKEAYARLAAFLKGADASDPSRLCMAGFILENTLSDNGSVTRGLCRTEGSHLTSVVETKNIIKTPEGPEADGVKLDPATPVSMNMWGLTPAFLENMDKAFSVFLSGMSDPKKDEFLLPIYIGGLLKDKKVSVEVLPTADKWFGVTYREDRDAVAESLADLADRGLYTRPLFRDLEA